MAKGGEILIFIELDTFSSKPSSEKIIVLVPKQKFRLYAENYHTQFFERQEQLAEAFGLAQYECTEIDCLDHKNEFQGRAFLYVGNF